MTVLEISDDVPDTSIDLSDRVSSVNNEDIRNQSKGNIIRTGLLVLCVVSFIEGSTLYVSPESWWVLALADVVMLGVIGLMLMFMYICKRSEQIIEMI